MPSYDGISEELLAHEVMREMHWSWADYQSTPLLVIFHTWSLIQARREAEKEAQDDANRSTSPNTRRVVRRRSRADAADAPTLPDA